MKKSELRKIIREEIQNVLAEASVALKKGDKVKDYGGTPYVVLDFGNWSKVAKYDSTGAGKEAYRMFKDTRNYVAVKDKSGETFVYTHGDDGVE